jgi:hypothetical protein
LKNLDAEVHINRAWETIEEKIKLSAKASLGYYELKKHKPWFDEGSSELLHQRKQAKLQWLQDPSQISGDNLNNVRHEARRHFRNKKDKIDYQVGLKLNVIHQLLVYVDDVNLLGDNIDTIKKNAEL